MKPYYEQGGVTLYHGDCRDILPHLAPCDVCICDPVWPNAVASLAGSSDPAGLFAQVAALLPGRCKRLVVQLGCDSDPRFLAGVPAEFPFFRACTMDYAMPHCKGRLLYGFDVAYAFGTAPLPRKGHTVVPGRCVSARVDYRSPGPRPWESKQTRPRASNALHPCPRRLEHVRWLVNWFADGPVVDPFAGLGTTLLAAKTCFLPAVGIEIEERFCELAARRLGQPMLPFPALGGALDALAADALED